MKTKYFLKSLVLVIFSVFLLFQITGCGGVTDEQIQSDMDKGVEEMVGPDEVIKIVEITETKENKEQKTEIVRCLVSTEDEKCSYQKEFVLLYAKDNENEWILDDIMTTDRNNWIITPLTGVEEKDILSSIEGMNVTIDGEIWDIGKDNISGISIEKQETDIEGKTDDVTVKVVIDDLVQHATGEFQLKYTFDSTWNLKECSGKESFTAEIKPGLELNVTDEMLISLIDGTIFEYGKKNVFQQEIALNKEEISEFKINSQTNSEKGKKNVYHCTFTLSKANAVFAMEMDVSYYYSEKWELQPITVSGKCVDVMIAGTWAGENELTINDVDEQGNIKGVYTYNGNGNSRYAYSYNVTGYIDLDAFVIFLKVKEVIGELPWRLNPEDFNVRIYVDEGKMSGYEDIHRLVLYLR